MKLKLIDNPNFRTTTFKSIINTPSSLLTRPPKSNVIDVKKKSLTTLSGKIRAKRLPTTPPKIAPINNDKIITENIDNLTIEHGLIFQEYKEHLDCLILQNKEYLDWHKKRRL